MSRDLKAWLPDWLTIFSAALIVFSFPTWNFDFLIWFALVPWFFALARARTFKAAFGQGVWLSVLMSLGGFYWVGYVLHEFAELPWPLAIVGLILYSIGGQPQFLIFAPIWRWMEARLALRSVLWAGVALGLVYAGIDGIIPKLFVDTLGHSLYASPLLRQAADLGGASLLTWLIFIVNYAFYRLLVELKRRSEPSLWPAFAKAGPIGLLALFAFLANLGYGSYRLPRILELTSGRHPGDRALQAAVIQANIGDFDKVASERGIRGAAQKILESFYTMSDQALSLEPKPDVLIWPETSYPSTFRTPSSADELARDQGIERFVRARGVPLLFGGYDHAAGKDYNAFFFLSPRAHAFAQGESDLQIYRKNVLLLFGEYIPGAETFSFIKRAFPQVGNFGRGAGPEVLSVYREGTDAPPVRVSPVICYEALFASYVLEAARKGSELILNITNDSWFGPWGEPQLHLSLVTFRSIEARLPQLRATNTGISAYITPDGTLAQLTQINEPEIMNVRIPVTPPIWTLMKAWGDWFPTFALVLGATLLLLARSLYPARHPSKT